MRAANAHAPSMLKSPLSRALPLIPLLAAALGAQTAPRPATADEALAFDVGEAVVQELVLPDALSGPLTVELFVDGAQRTLFVAPYSLRADGFQVLVQRADGSIERVEPAPVATVRGFLVGEPESYFAGSLTNGSLQGVLRTHTGASLHGLQPLSLVDASAPASLHLLHDSADALPSPYHCGTADVIGGRPTSGGTGAAAEGGPSSKWIEIAADADVEFYNKNGSSVSQTQNDVENVINGVDSIYNSDFNIRYLIGTILVRTSEPDPYTTSQAGPMLDQFHLEWALHQTAIKRDVAHLFTGKNIAGSTIGIANLNGICSLGAGYGVSQSKFSGSMTARVALTAHELGHNWGANHCNGTSQCKIMCSGLGGCSGGLTSFGPSASAEIEAKLALITCATGPPPTSAPTLTTVTPDTFPAFAPGLIELSGTSLEWVEQLTIGSAALTAPAGFTPIDDGTIFVSGLKTAPGLGAQSIVATNSIGTSNPASIAFTETFPPALINSVFALTDNDYLWKIGGEANDLWFLAVSVGDDTTVPLFGFNLLLNSQLVGAGTLDAVGVAEKTFFLPPSAAGLSFFSQAATVDGDTGQFRGASAVKASAVLI